MNDDMAARQKQYPVAHPFHVLAALAAPEARDRGAEARVRRARRRRRDGACEHRWRFAHRPKIRPIWKEIDKRGLPVLVHPTAPPGTAELDVMRYNLIASVGFMFDTSLAVARMIFDGFFDRYPSLKLIASHGGGALPYIAGRLDICFDNMPACRERISRRPRPI